MNKIDNDFAAFYQQILALDNFEMATQKIVEGFMLGQHKSPYHGYSAEFAQYKAYNAGEDIRNIDWKLFARSEKYYIKEYEEETNLRSRVYIDTSPSMQYKGDGLMSKIEYARYLSAAVIRILFNQKDAVGLAFSADNRMQQIPISAKAHLHREILKQIYLLETQAESRLEKDITELVKFVPRRGMVLIFSDFLADPDTLLPAMQQLAHFEADILLFQILDPLEVDFQFRKNAIFKDLETGQKLHIEPALMRSDYRLAMQRFSETLQHRATELNISFDMFQTHQPFTIPLRVFLQSRMRRL
jgi:uncharacterized protein (DUF58 family)